MNYFPCSNIGISVNGTPHKGVLKLRNEYVPKVDTFTMKNGRDDSAETVGAIFKFHNNLIVNKPSFCWKIQDGRWKRVGSSFLALNELYTGYTSVLGSGFQDNNFDYVGEDIYYAILLSSSPSQIRVYRVNADFTTTLISTSPDSIYSKNYPPTCAFKNENDEDCLIFQNTYNASKSYIYNISTDTWTHITMSPPYSGNFATMFSADEKGVIYCYRPSSGNDSNSYRRLYKYNVSTNTWTEIGLNTPNYYPTTPDFLTFSKVKCGDTSYFVSICRLGDYHPSGSSNYVTRLGIAIWDTDDFANNGPVYTEKIQDIYEVRAVFQYDDCIGMLARYDVDNPKPTGDSTMKGEIFRVIKLDPKDWKRYDMSIPHLVIDE